jgi:hypothetical protein
MQDFAAAEEAAAKAAGGWRLPPPRGLEEEVVGRNFEVLRAKALARAGRHKEADAALRSLSAFHADARVRSSDDIRVQVQLAEVALTTALIDGSRRKAKLEEAFAIMDRLPAEAKRTKPLALVREEMVRERAKGP